jgi:hypothetical protein
MKLLIKIISLILIAISFQASAAEQKPEVDSAGRKIIKGPVYGNYYNNVRIISNSVGVVSHSLTLMNSVIEAPVCVRTSGMDLSLIGNDLRCGLCVEFTTDLMMGVVASDNRCSGRFSNQ